MGIIEGGILALLSAIGGWFGGFFGSYFKRKGENLATKEDFAELKDQTRQLAQATKEIEVRIDDQVWNRQRQWELKRDTLFDATKRMADVGNKLLSLHTFWEHKLNGQLGLEESQVSLQNQYVIEWRDSMRSFEEIEELTRIICSTETMRAFTQLGNSLRSTAAKIVNGDMVAYPSSKTERNKLFGLAKLAVRKELGIEISIMPLSSGSSTGRSPTSAL